MLNTALEGSRQTGSKLIAPLRPTTQPLPERLDRLQAQLVGERPDAGGITYHSPLNTRIRLRQLAESLRQLAADTSSQAVSPTRAATIDRR